MVLYRIITVGSTKFARFQHCLFLLVVKVKNYISTISTFTDYKSERFYKKQTYLHSYFWRPKQLQISLLKNIVNANYSYAPIKNRLSIVLEVIEPAKADSITGNFETLGSKFSNETRFREAACVLRTIDKSNYKYISLVLVQAHPSHNCFCNFNEWNN